MAPDFSGARLKLDRAQQHLYALGHSFMAYAERKPYRLVEEFKPRPGEKLGDYRYIVADLRPTKAMWSAHIGEIVHDMRSALDYLAWATAARPWHKTQFPIFRRREDWEAKVEPMIRTIPDCYVALMEEAQPYQRLAAGLLPRDHRLAILNHLSNVDKHRLLHTTATALASAAPGFRGVRGLAALHEVYVHIGLLEEGTEIARLVIEPDDPDPEVAMDGEFRLDIAFRDTSAGGKAIDGAPVMVALVAIGTYVEKVYARFIAA